MDVNLCDSNQIARAWTRGISQFEKKIVDRLGDRRSLKRPGNAAIYFPSAPPGYSPDVPRETTSATHWCAGRC
jgi:hypothetical protein